MPVPPSNMARSIVAKPRSFSIPIRRSRFQNVKKQLRRRTDVATSLVKTALSVVNKPAVLPFFLIAAVFAVSHVNDPTSSLIHSLAARFEKSTVFPTLSKLISDNAHKIVGFLMFLPCFAVYRKNNLPLLVLAIAGWVYVMPDATIWVYVFQSSAVYLFLANRNQNVRILLICSCVIAYLLYDGTLASSIEVVIPANGTTTRTAPAPKG